MPNAIEFEELLAYADGRLSDDEARQLEAHLALDPKQSQALSLYRLVRSRVAEDDSVEPSRSALARAIALFNPAALPQQESWLAAVERFIAGCIFDSRVELAGLRYASDDRINLSYQTDFADVDLQVERAASPSSTSSPQQEQDRWHVMGQINHPAGDHHERIALTQSGSIVPLVETAADEYGVFSLQVSSGRYDLHVQLPKGIMILPDVNIT